MNVHALLMRILMEREKLQAIIEELKLQRSRYFDPATAQRLGKVAGAELAVTGAFTEFDPRLRLDIRLIEVATGKVLLAEKVVGEASAFFDLQQELVDAFVRGLDVKLKASARARSGATGLGGLLKYSRGVDAADQGDLGAASAALAEVVKESPDFKLARDRYAELLGKLEASGRKRATLFSTLEAELLARAEARTRDGLRPLLGEQRPPADPDAWFRWHVARREPVQQYLGSRALQLNLYLAKVAGRFKPEGNAPGMVTVMPVPDQREVLKLVTEVRAATERLVEDYRVLTALDPRVRWKEPFVPLLPDEDQQRLKAINLVWGAHLWADSAAQLEADLGKLLLTGATGWGPAHFAVRPTPAQLEPSLVKPALEHLAHAEQVALALGPEDRPDALLAVLDAAAEGLLALGKKEEAVARWQRFLDQSPSHPRYQEVEKKVRQALCATDECRAFEAALATCDGPTLMLRASTALGPLAWADGARGLRHVLDTLAARCPARDPAYPQLGYHTAHTMVVLQVATQALGLGECGLAREARRWVEERAGATYAMSFQVWSACQ